MEETIQQPMMPQMDMGAPTVPGMVQEEKTLSDKLNEYKQKRIQGEAKKALKKNFKPIEKPNSMFDTLLAGMKEV